MNQHLEQILKPILMAENPKNVTQASVCVIASIHINITHRKWSLLTIVILSSNKVRFIAIKKITDAFYFFVYKEKSKMY